MSYIFVDIKEKDLSNFMDVDCALFNVTDEWSKECVEKRPFTLFRKRMMGDDFLTIQIPLRNYVKYCELGLIWEKVK